MKKLFYFFIPILIISCDSGLDENNQITGDGFDRSLILSNTYDNIIMPSYNEFENRLADLNSNTEKFVSNVNEQNLSDLRLSWVTAYKSWQAIEMFNLRKAEEIQYAIVSNAYPCIEDQIQNIVEWYKKNIHRYPKRF